MNVLFLSVFFVTVYAIKVLWVFKKKKKKTYKRGGTSLVYVIYTRTDRVNGSWKST